MTDVTRILCAIERADLSSAARLVPLVYDELRKLGSQKLAPERPGQTLQPTALVHEAYVRLVDTEKAQHWDSRRYFFGAAAEALSQLGQEDPLAVQLVKLRYLAGMSVEEAADVLDVSRTTTYRHWTYARAWIRAKVKAGRDSPDSF